MGRRKISIKQIADPKLRHITFNKRRNGLIKKAAELSLLCNVNMLLIFEDGNGNLIQFSRNKITTIPSFFKECTYSSVSEFTARDYPNFFKVNHYKKHKDEDGNEELQEEMAAEQEEMPSAFEDPALPAPQIKILNKRDTFSNAHHSTDDGYMSDHMVYYSGSEESVHEGNDGVRTFPETPMREPYYNQPKPSQYAMAKLRAPRSEENQKPILYEAEISRPYPEEQETSPIHREREPREPREARESRELCQNYREMPPRGPIVDDKPMDYAQPYPHERPDRPMKRPSYSENGPYPYRYYPGPHMPPYYDYPPHAYPYPYGYPYPPYGYPTKHRPRAYREVMPGDEAVNSMFKYSSRGFGMEPEPYLGKQSSKPEMDDRITNTANMVKYLNNSGTNTYAGQKIYNFYSSENGKPEEEPQPQPQPQPQVNYPKTNRAVDFEGVPYDVEPEYQEINPYHRGPDHRYENSNTTNGTIPTNLPAAYFSSRKFNFEGYPNSFEDDRFNEFSDPKKKLKQ